MDAQNLHQRDGKSSQGVMTAELGPERSEVLARQRVPSSVISLYKCPEARERSFIQTSIHSFTCSRTHSFNNYSPSTYYVPGTLQGAGVGYRSEPGT